MNETSINIGINNNNTSNSFSNISQHKSHYIILGEKYELNGYKDAQVVAIIATLNVLGKPYWIELKKQNFSFGPEIDSFIEKQIIIIDREKKINTLLK